MKKASINMFLDEFAKGVLFYDFFKGEKCISSFCCDYDTRFKNIPYAYKNYIQRDTHIKILEII